MRIAKLVNDTDRKTTSRTFCSLAAPAEAVKDNPDLGCNPNRLGKGRTVEQGWTGSSTDMFVNYVLATVGLTPQDVSFIGVGRAASAVAAIKKG
jgi:ABC-type nitrate/sulfonate/bicarbonate transport system substrate-binding protein